MALRIAFDLDGVLADMDAALLRQAEIAFGEAITRRLPEGAATEGERAGLKTGAKDDQLADEPPADPKGAIAGFPMTRRLQRRLWHHIRSVDNFWETLEEIEAGSIVRLARLAVERRWEIIFLTRRPRSAGDTSQVQTQRWLQSKGFPLPSTYVVPGSRGRIAAALGLDYVIDDTPENCLDVVADSNARAVLVWRRNETQLPTAARRLGIEVVTCVGECLDMLAQVDIPVVRTAPVERRAVMS